MSSQPILERYSTKEMKEIFSEEAKISRWMLVEAALAKAHASLGNIPVEAASEIGRKANLQYVKLERIREIEQVIDHDLMAMVRALSEVCGGEAGGYVHLGATSYDIEDTAWALAFKQSLAVIERELKAFMHLLAGRADETKELICIGRTHGQHAVPTTYGMKFALWSAEIQRHIERLNEMSKRALVGKMSGAVGTMASFGEKGFEIERLVMKELGLQPALVTTQVIQRDRHAEVILYLVLIASTLDKIAREIRNLQRTEIGEVFEPFRGKQVGSSTMPHKRNPHKCERITSLARIVKALAIPAIDNIPLEHERDLTNSANERIMHPDAFTLTHYMLKSTYSIVEGLEINRLNIERNLQLTGGMILAERIMQKLVEKGLNRERAYDILRQKAIEASSKKVDFKSLLKSDPTLSSYLEREEIITLLDPHTYIGMAPRIVDRVLEKLGLKVDKDNGKVAAD